MAAYADGTLIKASGPEVAMVKYIGDRPERRWIPDPPTLNDMGLNWGAMKWTPFVRQPEPRLKV
jgi:hypothetical protein